MCAGRRNSAERGTTGVLSSAGSFSAGVALAAQKAATTATSKHAQRQIREINMFSREQSWRI